MFQKRRLSNRLKNLRKINRRKNFRMPQLANNDVRTSPDDFQQHDFLCVFGLVLKSTIEDLVASSDDGDGGSNFRLIKKNGKRKLSQNSDITNNNTIVNDATKRNRIDYGN